jgi:hypothetical protein
MVTNSLKLRPYLKADLRSGVIEFPRILYNIFRHFYFHNIMLLDVVQSQTNLVHTVTVIW